MDLFASLFFSPGLVPGFFFAPWMEQSSGGQDARESDQPWMEQSSGGQDARESDQPWMEQSSEAQDVRVQRRLRIQVVVVRRAGCPRVGSAMDAATHAEPMDGAIQHSHMVLPKQKRFQQSLDYQSPDKVYYGKFEAKLAA